MLEVGVKSPVFMGKRVIKFALLAVLCLGAFAPGVAMSGENREEQAVAPFRATDLPLPRYVSLRSDKVYVRAGPGLRYPIKWIYKRAGMPVEVVQEFESWRKVKGYDGDEGWVHQSLLSGERTVLITQAPEPVPMRDGYNGEARMVARLEPQVVASVDKCSGEWCRIETGGYRGWVERNFLWGIYENEDFN